VDELFGNNRWQQNSDNEIPKIDRKGAYNGPDKHQLHKRSQEDEPSRFMKFVGVLRHMAVGVKHAGR
jgi:hypothetical protein